MVPLVIPEKARPLMEFLADREVRRGAGVSSNPYMFANQSRPVGSGAAWRPSPHQKSTGREREKDEKEKKKEREGEKEERGEKEKKARRRARGLVMWV